MDPNICAPGKYDQKNNTCFTLEQLQEMIGAYNRYVTKKKFNLFEKNLSNFSIIKLKNDKKYLLLELFKRFDSTCGNNELCLTKQKFMDEIEKEMMEDITTNTFRPIGPKKPTEWLSTSDITKIMNQYENVYPNFRYIGTVPSNCSKLDFCPLYKFNFDEYLMDKIDNLGVIFNLDEYGERGSHWVSLFMNLTNREIYFCDSNGKQPSDNITDIIKHFTEYFKKKEKK